MSSLQRVPTEQISPTHNHTINDMATSDGALMTGRQVNHDGLTMPPCSLKRTYALYMESDEESDDDEPPQAIEDVLARIHFRYPAMNFLQYSDTLKEHGIFYLQTAAHFDSKFYQEKVGMPEGVAITFCACMCKAHMKEARGKARRKSKGKMKA